MSEYEQPEGSWRDAYLNEFHKHFTTKRLLILSVLAMAMAVAPMVSSFEPLFPFHTLFYAFGAGVMFGLA